MQISELFICLKLTRGGYFIEVVVVFCHKMAIKLDGIN